jgi:hypothetical protein
MHKRKQDSRATKPQSERTGDSKRRFRLRQDEINMLEKYRRIRDEADSAGVDFETVKSGWLKTDKTSLYFTNPDYKTPEQKQFDLLREDLLEELKQYSPTYPKIKRKASSDGHLLVIDPADIHIGKLCTSFESGEDYNQQIAVQRVKDGVKGILNKSAGWNIDKIVFIIGNDVLHTDTPKSTTTSGTSQDTDGMWYDNFLNGMRLYCDVIETLMSIADVHVSFNPSNHDYQSGFYLAQVIQTHFRKSKNITFDVSISHRKYYKYFNNLIGSTHGDGAKQSDLPLLMAQESKDWSETKHRYIYTHHVHHKTSKDFVGVTVESLRSPSGTDSWHHRNGYQHNPKAIEGFIHHKEFGQIARLTHIF